MATRRYIAVTLVGVLAMWGVRVVRAADAPIPPTLQSVDEKTHIATLQSNAPLADKMAACRELARVGTKESVPVLAGLLADEQLSHMARNALEGIADPAAADALREAMGKVKGRLLAGVVGSCGRKHDEKAVDAIAKLLDDSDADVAYAAAYALGKIGNDSAATALEKALVATPIRPMVAEGYLMCAESLVATGKSQQAIAMYDRVRGADVPGRTKMAAMRGAILARGPAGVAMVIEAIRGDSPQMLAVALRISVEMPGGELTKAMSGEIEKLPAEKQLLVIEALGNRGDAAAVPAIIAVKKSGVEAVSLAAVNALGQLGDASVAPVLLDLATDDDAALSRTAQSALAGLTGQAVDSSLLAKLASGTAKERRVALNVLSQRRVPALTPELTKLVRDGDAAIRNAAIRSLGEMSSIDQLDALLGVLEEPVGEGDAASADWALSAACARLANPDACAGKLIAHLPGAQPQVKRPILGVLRTVGGTKALEAVRAAAKEPTEIVSDAAVRALCDWPTGDAAGDLLDLAKTSSNATYKALALRGYIRLIGQTSIPEPQKLAMCKEAALLVQTDQQKTQLFGALANINEPGALNMLAEYIDQEAVRRQASTAALTVAERLVKTNPRAVVNAMNKILETTQDPELARRARTVLAQAIRGA